MRNNLKIPSKTAKQVIQDSCRQRSKGCWPIKTGLREKQVLQDPGYVRGVEGPCCMLHGILQDCTNTVKGVERNKIIINEYLRLHLRLLFVISEVSKALYTQMNRMKPQILQWLPYYLIQSRSHCNSNFNSK